NPTNVAANLDYARFLRLRGRKDAVKYIKAARALEPDNSSILAELIKTFAATDQAAEALEYLPTFLRVSGDADEIDGVGEALERRGLLDGALDAYHRALEITPGEPTLYLGMGNIWMQKKDPAEALRFYKLGTEVAPSGLGCVFNCGQALSLLDNSEAGT